MKEPILVPAALPSEVRDRLAESFEVLTEPTPENLGRIVGLIAGTLIKPDPGLLGAAPHVRAIATISAGYDGFDVADLTRRGIALLNTPDVPTETTADVAFALILASARRVAELDAFVREGSWTGALPKEKFGVGVSGKTLGLVGMGRIGAAVAKRAALGFGMPILYTSRSAKPDAEARFGANRCEMPTLLAESDFVCVTVPLSPETRHLIGWDQLSQMKRSAILINVARGAVLDEQALIKALAENLIHAAGLDVYDQEPLSPDSPLLKMRNVVLLPHIGTAISEIRYAMIEEAIDNFVGYLCRGETRGLVNPGNNLR